MAIKNISTESNNTSNSSNSKVVIPNLRTDRLGTLSFLSWWKREVVQKARVLVVGAGALGNEVLKNLALMGIGNIYIIDLDTIEAANLSRSILFREKDQGYSKAEVAAARLLEINPEINVHAIHGDLHLEIGAGFIRQMDVVIGCLDNREARWRINELCYRVKVPWIEGAIENLWGKAQVFDPRTEHACYNCTLNEAAQREMSVRRSCKMYALREIQQGKVPTTSIVGSIVGAMQIQEALKIMHGMEVRPGVVYRYNGFAVDLTDSEDRRRDDCDQHFTYQNIVEIEDGYCDSMTGAQLLYHASQMTGESCTLMLGFDFVMRGKCSDCEHEREIMKPLHLLHKQKELHVCPNCGAEDSLSIDEFNDVTNKIIGYEPHARMILSDLGVAPLSILEVITSSGKLIPFELSGDRERFGLQHERQ